MCHPNHRLYLAHQVWGMGTLGSLLLFVSPYGCLGNHSDRHWTARQFSSLAYAVALPSGSLTAEAGAEHEMLVNACPYFIRVL